MRIHIHDSYVSTYRQFVAASHRVLEVRKPLADGPATSDAQLENRLKFRRAQTSCRADDQHIAVLQKELTPGHDSFDGFCGIVPRRNRHTIARAALLVGRFSHARADWS